MSKKPNIEKVKKEIDKCPDELLYDFISQIRSYANEKILSRSKEYQELANKFASQSDKIQK
jgi:hypothetical protein